MRIRNLQIMNYKSFKNSGPIEFGDGFNVIVGQNNSGKTALLECVCPRLMTNNPHKELQDGGPALQNPDSRVEFELLISGQEYKNIVLSAGGRHTVFLQSDNQEQIVQEIDSLWDEREIRLGFQYSRNAKVWSPKNRRKNAARVQVNADKTTISFMGMGVEQKSFADIKVAEQFFTTTYLFKAERLALAQHQINDATELQPNAQNLATAILHLQTRSPGRFERLNSYLREIFPSVHGISAKLESNQAILRVWTIDELQEFEQLSINLADSGTGVGQAIAILYVVVNSDFPRVLVIDEPNSFLHPSAARALLRILRARSHQYIVSTHAAEIISLAEPTTLHLVRWDGAKSVIDVLSAKEVQDVRRALTNIGVRLSDVFGANQILWVEGQTEQECFPILMKYAGKELPPGLSVVAVRNTGDFEGRKPKAALIWQIYKRLSESNALIPPAMGFSFDREGRIETEMEDMRRESANKVSFLPRKTYENYLIEPRGLASLLSIELGTQILQEKVEEWLSQRGGDITFEAAADWTGSIVGSNWLRNVHGAKLLASLVVELSEARLEYQKPGHSIWLTEWLLSENVAHLADLTRYVTSLIE